MKGNFSRDQIEKLLYPKARTEEQVSYYMLLYHINKMINYNRCYTHLAVKQTEAQGNDLSKLMLVTGRT